LQNTAFHWTKPPLSELFNQQLVINCIITSHGIMTFDSLDINIMYWLRINLSQKLLKPHKNKIDIM
jgi:hypothetical protein